MARRSLASSLADLDDRLVRGHLIDGRQLVVVPVGVLGTLPWGMLPSLRGVPVTVAPSATSWLQGLDAVRPAADPAGPLVMALAGPDLYRADAEATIVAGEWPRGSAHTGLAATGARLLTAMSQCDIVHVAAHGRHDRDNPLFSSIELSDGAVFGYDLTANIRPGIQVILSACDLGLSTIRPGDESLGLTRALLHYGASTVISVVAWIDDDVAADAMARYHRHLAQGVSPAEALARATESGDIAPLVCFGAGT